MAEAILSSTISLRVEPLPCNIMGLFIVANPFRKNKTVQSSNVVHVELNMSYMVANNMECLMSQMVVASIQDSQACAQLKHHSGDKVKLQKVAYLEF